MDAASPGASSVLVDFKAARVELGRLRLALVERRAEVIASRDLLWGGVVASRGHWSEESQGLRYSRLARLEAKLESLPVIEQAKGVLICQSGCSAEEAFDILRRASQRTNVKVRDLAAQIVAHAQTSNTDPDEAVG